MIIVLFLGILPISAGCINMYARAQEHSVKKI